MTMPSQNTSPRLPFALGSPRPNLLPSPFSHIDETLSAAASHHHHQHDEDPPHQQRSTYSAYIEPRDAGDLLPPPNFFSPFFTMISDAESRETYHPSTYYVFADDEPDVLAQAALHALDSSRQQPGEIQGEEERYVLLSLDSDGSTIVSVKSLALEWAVTSAEVRAAPTFDGDGTRGEGLMLMVEGMGMAWKGAGEMRTNEEREAKAKEHFEEARRRNVGNMVVTMEDLASNVVGGMGVLEKVLSLD